MRRVAHSIAILIVTAAALLGRCGTLAADTILDNSVMPYPPSSYVEFSKFGLKWETETATPAVEIVLTAVAKINDERPSSSVSVSAVSADLTADGGRTWRTYEFRKDAKEESVWKARLEFPEWRTGNKETAAAAGKEGMDDGENGGETLSLSGRSITKTDEKTRILFKGRPKSEIKTESEEPPSEEPRYPKGAFALICFSATDSMGNTTSELCNQAGPRYESEVHFKTVIVDPEESKDEKESKYRDIVEVSAAWLRDKVFLRLAAAAKENTDIITNSYLNYFAVRFIEAGMNPVLEQAGNGIYHYVLANREKIWPRKDPLSEKPFELELKMNYVNNLDAVMRRADRDLTPEQKKLKKQIMDNKFDTSFSIYTNKAVDGSVLETLIDENRVYWRINSKALRKGTADGGVFRMTFFSGSSRNYGAEPFIMYDKTSYATVSLKYHRLIAGQDVVTDETVEWGTQ